MLVCDCYNINYNELKQIIIDCNFDKELIQEKSDVGTACGCCVKSKCSRVDLTLDEAILKTREEL